MSTPSPIRERLAADMLDADRSREQAAVARAGGRLLTSKLAHRIADFDTPGMYQTVSDLDPRAKPSDSHPVIGEVPVWIAALAGRLGAEKLNDCWRLMLDAAGDNGRKAWQWAAEHRAGVGKYPDRSYEDPTIAAVMLHEAEAMLDWPIYRAAMQAETYADLWSQAGEGEERVLDTLARASGITTPPYLKPGHFEDLDR